MNYCQFRNETIKRMANAGGGLPTRYQQVEYLQGSGTQYIVTNCGIELGQEIHVGVMFTPATDNIIMCTYGGYDGATVPTQFFYGGGGTTVFKNYAQSGTVKSRYFALQTKYDIIAQRSAWVTINGTGYQLQTYSGYEGDSTSLKLEIFARGLRTDPNYLHGRIYYFYVLDSAGNKQCDIIPCYRKSDNKPGMYDLVTNTFFTNAGSGEFTVGNNV